MKAGKGASLLSVCSKPLPDPEPLPCWAGLPWKTLGLEGPRNRQVCGQECGLWLSSASDSDLASHFCSLGLAHEVDHGLNMLRTVL